MIKSIGLTVIGASMAVGQDTAVSARRIREHTRFLASDWMEGRGVGQRGGQLATEYIASQLALAGARPGADGSYFQTVPLVGIETQPDSTLRASSDGKAAGKGVDFRWGDDFTGQTGTQQPNQPFEGEAVFVGHGITAPEFKWDDFRGVDVKNKILVLFTNEP